MMVFKRKQIVVLSLVLMIVVAGYLQYSYKKSGEALSTDKSATKAGEAVYVDSGNDSVIGESDQTADASLPGNDVFAQVKMEKDVERSKDTDMLDKITTDPNASQKDKSKAYEQKMKILSNAQKEQRIELLIKQTIKCDALVLLSEDNNMDITVKTPTLTAQQVAQIADIASRQANIDLTNIKVKNVN